MQVDGAKGDPDVPMTKAEVDAKFADCADYGGMPAERARTLRQMVERIDAIPDVSRLTAELVLPG